MVEETKLSVEAQDEDENTDTTKTLTALEIPIIKVTSENTYNDGYDSDGNKLTKEKQTLNENDNKKDETDDNEDETTYNPSSSSSVNPSSPTTAKNDDSPNDSPNPHSTTIGLDTPQQDSGISTTVTVNNSNSTSNTIGKLDPRERARLYHLKFLKIVTNGAKLENEISFYEEESEQTHTNINRVIKEGIMLSLKKEFAKLQKDAAAFKIWQKQYIQNSSESESALSGETLNEEQQFIRGYLNKQTNYNRNRRENVDERTETYEKVNTNGGAILEIKTRQKADESDVASNTNNTNNVLLNIRSVKTNDFAFDPAEKMKTFIQSIYKAKMDQKDGELKEYIEKYGISSSVDEIKGKIKSIEAVTIDGKDSLKFNYNSTDDQKYIHDLIENFSKKLVEEQNKNTADNAAKVHVNIRNESLDKERAKSLSFKPKDFKITKREEINKEIQESLTNQEEDEHIDKGNGIASGSGQLQDQSNNSTKDDDNLPKKSLFKKAKKAKSTITSMFSGSKTHEVKVKRRKIADPETTIVDAVEMQPMNPVPPVQTDTANTNTIPSSSSSHSYTSGTPTNTGSNKP